MKFDEIHIFTTEECEVDFISFLLSNGEITGTCADNEQSMYTKGGYNVHVFENVELDLPENAYFDDDTDEWKRGVNTKVALESIIGVSGLQSCVGGSEQLNTLKISDVLFYRKGVGKCFALDKQCLRYANGQK